MFQLFSGGWLVVVTSPARSGALFHGLSALGQLLFLGSGTGLEDFRLKLVPCFKPRTKEPKSPISLTVATIIL